MKSTLLRWLAAAIGALLSVLALALLLQSLGAVVVDPQPDGSFAAPEGVRIVARSVVIGAALVLVVGISVLVGAIRRESRILIPGGVAMALLWAPFEIPNVVRLAGTRYEAGAWASLAWMAGYFGVAAIVVTAAGLALRRSPGKMNHEPDAQSDL